MRYGLIGKSLPHSFSPEIHKALGNSDYVIRELAPSALPEFIKQKEYIGLNVTIPYKQDVIPLLDEIDAPSRAIGAVNTIHNKDGRLYGYNTDYIGFSRLLKENEITLKGKSILILGTGGTSKTVRAVCQNEGATTIHRVSRRGKTPDAPEDEQDLISYDEATSKFSDTQIIINTTPSGMYPDVDCQPITLDSFGQLEAVADVIYNPLTTKLVLDARKRGIKAVNGLAMLVYQAEAAEEIWGVDLSGGKSGVVVARQMALDKRNLVLIGMPGSGKSTIGKLVAKSLGRELVDTDQFIEQKAGRSIPSIFAKEGETYFRDLESEVCRDLMTRTGLIISTGGGLILRDENVDALRKNGTIVYLNRDIEKIIAGNSRPLAKSPEDIKRLYDNRHEKYEAAADVTVKVEGTPAQTAKETEDAFTNH